MNKPKRIRITDTPKRRLSPEEVAAALGAKQMTPEGFHEWWLGQHEGAPLTRLERAVIDAAMAWTRAKNDPSSTPESRLLHEVQLEAACGALLAERSKG